MAQRDPLYTISPSTARLLDLPERMRPREEMDRLGVENVSDDVLLALVLRSGVHGLNVVDLAESLLQHYGSLTALAEAPVQELERARGLGPVKSRILKAALDLGRRLNEESMPTRAWVRTPEDAARLLRDRVRTLETEVFWTLHLDSKNRLRTEPRRVTQGLLDASLVHPREVFRDAIRTATAAVVLAHNHPSGDPTPSAEDIRITRQLVDAGRIVDIKVLDHIILGRKGGEGPDFLSMREQGLMEFG